MSDPGANERNALHFIAYICRYDAVRYNSGFKPFGPGGVVSETARIAWAQKSYEDKAEILKYVEDVLDDKQKGALEDVIESLKIKRAGPRGKLPAESIESLSRYWVEAVGPAPQSLPFHQYFTRDESERSTERSPRKQGAKESDSEEDGEASSSDLSDWE